MSSALKSEVTAYRIEAMASFQPIKIADQIFDGEWREIQFKEGDGGVPTKPKFSACSHIYDEYGVMTETSALALMYWFKAYCTNEVGGYGIEARLAEYKIKYESSCERVETKGEKENE